MLAIVFGGILIIGLGITFLVEDVELRKHKLFRRKYGDTDAELYR